MPVGVAAPGIGVVSTAVRVAVAITATLCVGGDAGEHHKGGQQHHDRRAGRGAAVAAQGHDGEGGREGAVHEHLGVREVDQLEHAVDQRVAQRDQRVQAADGHGVDEGLEELGHLGGSTVATYAGLPPFMTTITAGFLALRFSSIE